ncbi:MAG: hypothetical protein IT440_04515 [Phycisphaeraceae bacterium]|nr:hypothetical protein [Phycisphaeraceae bacterium]
MNFRKLVDWLVLDSRMPPKYVELRGDHGQRKVYAVQIGRKKFGIGLNGVDPEVEQMLLERQYPKK